MYSSFVSFVRKCDRSVWKFLLFSPLNRINLERKLRWKCNRERANNFWRCVDSSQRINSPPFEVEKYKTELQGGGRKESDRFAWWKMKICTMNRIYIPWEGIMGNFRGQDRKLQRYDRMDDRGRKNIRILIEKISTERGATRIMDA